MQSLLFITVYNEGIISDYDVIIAVSTHFRFVAVNFQEQVRCENNNNKSDFLANFLIFTFFRENV